MSELFRAGAVGATLLAAAVMMAAPAATQIYRAGQACWPETPCPAYGDPGGEGTPKQALSRRAKPAPRPRPNSPAAASDRRAVRASPARPAGWPGEPRLYRYPTMYRAEAPPLLPPGAQTFPPYAQQPYVLVSQGVWYWPGANDFKMPQVRGFEPLIDPSRVISW